MSKISTADEAAEAAKALREHGMYETAKMYDALEARLRAEEDA